MELARPVQPILHGMALSATARVVSFRSPVHVCNAAQTLNFYRVNAFVISDFLATVLLAQPATQHVVPVLATFQPTALLAPMPLTHFHLAFAH